MQLDQISVRPIVEHEAEKYLELMASVHYLGNWLDTPKVLGASQVGIRPRHKAKKSVFVKPLHRHA
jgi:hypothetical protein